MADSPAPIRSYQRIFRPERRIYQIDGRALPVPGGVPLRWLAYAAVTLVAILLICGRSVLVLACASAVGALAGANVAGSAGRVVGGLAGLGGVTAASCGLGAVDWPVRLVLLPLAVATVGTQVCPDGRPAHRFLMSWCASRLRPAHCSLERALAADDRTTLWDAWLWVSPDHHTPAIGRGRVRGPAQVQFAQPVVLARRRGRHVARPTSAHRRVRAGEVVVDVVELGPGQVVEVRR